MRSGIHINILNQYIVDIFNIDIGFAISKLNRCMIPKFVFSDIKIIVSPKTKIAGDFYGALKPIYWL